MSLSLIVGGILMVGLGLFNLAAALLPRHRLLHAGLWWRIGSGTGPGVENRAGLAISGIALIAAAVYIVVVAR